MTQTQRYIPPLRFDWLTPIYDPVLRRMMPEMELKAALIAQAAVGGSQRILDLGAGTGTLTLALKHAAPAAEVVGLDGDARVIEMARQKAAEAGLSIRFDLGFATVLPYDSNSFDRVFASLMLHHLTLEDKRAALGEVWRVLRPGGQFHVLDFGKPHNLPAHLISLVMRHMEETRELIAGCFPMMLQEAGFDHVEETARRLTLIGTLSLYRDVKAIYPGHRRFRRVRKPGGAGLYTTVTFSSTTRHMTVIRSDPHIGLGYRHVRLSPQLAKSPKPNTRNCFARLSRC